MLATDAKVLQVPPDRPLHPRPQGCLQALQVRLHLSTPAAAVVLLKRVEPDEVGILEAGGALAAAPDVRMGVAPAVGATPAAEIAGAQRAGERHAPGEIEEDLRGQGGEGGGTRGGGARGSRGPPEGFDHHPFLACDEVFGHTQRLAIIRKERTCQDPGWPAPLLDIENAAPHRAQLRSPAYQGAWH